jgi:hypothetical protein
VSIALLREMFAEMVEAKDISKVPVYYAEDLTLRTNGRVQGYEQFLADHRSYYASAVTYSVELDEDTLVEQGERVAGRCWITTARPGEEPVRLEVLLIARYRDGKITDLWELVWPDWADLPAFSERDG